MEMRPRRAIRDTVAVRLCDVHAPELGMPLGVVREPLLVGQRRRPGEVGFAIAESVRFVALADLRRRQHRRPAMGNIFLLTALAARSVSRPGTGARRTRTGSTHPFAGAASAGSQCMRRHGFCATHASRLRGRRVATSQPEATTFPVASNS